MIESAGRMGFVQHAAVAKKRASDPAHLDVHFRTKV
jgi:hypothetical protein